MSRGTKIIIAVATLALIVAGVLVWYFFFRSKPAAEQVTGAFPSSGEQAFPQEEVAPTEVPVGVFKPILRQLTTEPVAGAVAGGKGGATIVRYLDRATGNAYEIPADGGSAKRLTNTTIPKIYEAFWSRNGVAVVARYLKEDGETVESFSATIKPKSGGEGDLAGVFLPQNITALALAPSGTELFYLRDEGGGAVGIRAGLNGSGKTEVFRSPLREWLPLWSAQSAIALLSKPSAVAEGMLGVVNAGGGELRPLIRGVRGLTVLPDHELKQILYSASTENGVTLNLLAGAGGVSRALSLATLSEKCVWAKSNRNLYCGVPSAIPGGSYPDAWYQGVVSFSDGVWSIAAGDLKTELISDITSEAGAPIDMVEPQLDPDERFLVFQNKNDDTLWSLQLKN